MSLWTTVTSKIFGDPNSKIIHSLQSTVDQINALEPTVSDLTDEQLKQKTPEFKQRLSAGESLDDLLPEAFAVVREASKRVLKMRHFDVQLIGGIVMHQGRIAEMKTGEGKTLVCTLPAYLNALVERGVYVVTVNEYLASRDSEWMGQLYEFLGLSVGLLRSNNAPETRLAAYKADITYGTNNEFGFDYLRDNLSTNYDDYAQKDRYFTIVDEVDSILIDEARTPLIISGPIPDSAAKYKKVVRAVQTLKETDHYTIDEKHKNAILTEEGIQEIEKNLGIDNIYAQETMGTAHMALQCLKALHLYKKDVDYVVKDGQVMIVDEFTGRILDGRRYSDGLHQAIEALEKVNIQEESQTLASVTYQNYFRLFPKIAGMTGTAKTEEEEFVKIYGLDVVCIPTNKTIAREDLSDVIYKTRDQKFKAIANDVKEAHKKGQPVLIGTITIEASETLSKFLKDAKIPHHVLNAKYHEKEAEIISNAGQKGAVTIATNMAGRGTDIVLGDGVAELGGLYVIGSSRHESRRIDNQLRGRSGRQGDPGQSKFYVGLDDELMRLFGSDRISGVMDRLGMPDDTPIEHGMVTKSIERAQKKVEQYHFSMRKQILEYDNVLDKQRTTVYDLRLAILTQDQLSHRFKEAIQDIVQGMLIDFNVLAFSDKKKDGELPKHIKDDLIVALQEIFPVKNMDEVLNKSLSTKDPQTELVNLFYSMYVSRKRDYAEGLYEKVASMVLLQTLDTKWMDHLHNMDILREGIGLRAYGQKDPLMEYKMEAFTMFKELLQSVYADTLKMVYRIQIQTQGTDAPAPPSVLDTPGKVVSNTDATPAKETAEPSDADDKTGRNDPCPCGSGKKYKKCCMS